jgi:hypothetical protein
MKFFAYASAGLLLLLAAGALYSTRLVRQVGPSDAASTELSMAALGEDIVRYLTITPEKTGEWQGELPAGEYEFRVRVKATSPTDAGQNTTVSKGPNDSFVFTSDGQEIGRVVLSYEFELDILEEQRGLSSGSLASTRVGPGAFIVGTDMWVGQHRGGAGAFRVSARAEGSVEVADIVAAVGHGAPAKVSSAL